MMRYSLFYLLLLVICSCSVTKEITSTHSSNNDLQNGSYTSFYNKELGISEDLYAIYSPNSKSYTILDRDYRYNENIIKRLLLVKVEPEHFVFNIKSDLIDISTQMYYLPNCNVEESKIYGYAYKGRCYNLFSVQSGNDAIIQLFSSYGKENDTIFNKECNSILQKLCYNEFYKRTYWNSDKIQINFSDNKESVAAPTNIDQLLNQGIDTTNKRVFVVAESRGGSVKVGVKLSNKLDSIRSRNNLYIYLYYRNKLMSEEIDDYILKEHIKTKQISLDIKASYDDYFLIIADDKLNVYEMCNINVL